MPSGKTHDRITLWSLPWVSGLTLLVTRDPKLTLIVAATFLFSGLMFGPDLDIYSVQYKRWGWLRWIWRPYQKALRHRSSLSHGLIIGTSLRLVYFLGILSLVGMLITAIAQLIWGFTWNWQEFAQKTFDWFYLYPAEGIALFLGLELGAMSHSFSDWTGSSYKRWQKRRKKINQSKSSRSKK
ncbi:MAG: metal-binding protein [Spirulinaceae cyanobacterium]